jgi:hypothetical protein
MADLEFISTISTTFVDEINKFITTFTSTIKSQFEDIESKVKAQELEINKLREELNSKKYEEKNYTSVSVIKNQDKQIHELNNTIKTLESRLKYLEQRASSSKEPIKSIIEDKKGIDIIVEHVEIIDKDTIENSDRDIDTPNTDAIVQEKALEIIPEPISVKKIVKKTSKKTNVEPVVEISPTPPEPITEKPKRKIAMKKNVKTELHIVHDTVETEKEEAEAELEKERIESERIEKEKADAEAEAELEKERIEKEKAEADAELEKERIEKEKAEAEAELEKEKAKTTKTKKTEVKKEKETKPSTSVKKEKETKKPVEIEKEEENIKYIEVKYPDTIPHLDTVNILELDNIEYYLDEITNNVFQITPSEEIGAFIGVYDKDSKKINKMV